MRLTLACVTALALGACTPKLLFNQTFLVSEDLRVTSAGYVSLKSTGETFDISPIRLIEGGRGERVVIAKVHGSFILTGDGFHKLWRLWPVGRDAAKYKALDYDPGPDGFRGAALEIVGKCVVVHWDRGGNAATLHVTGDGDVDENKCKEP